MLTHQVQTMNNDCLTMILFFDITTHTYSCSFGDFKVIPFMSAIK
jgi:hypothetical protein